MDFIRRTSKKMNLWPVEHLFPPFFSRSVLIQCWSGKKRGKKVFNWSEVHFFGSTSYEIHTLVDHLTIKLNCILLSLWIMLWTSGHTLGIWICRCSLFYRRELWALKSAVSIVLRASKFVGAKCDVPNIYKFVHPQHLTCTNAFPGHYSSNCCHSFY